MYVRDAREMTVEIAPAVEIWLNLVDLEGRRRHVYCINV